MDEYIKKFRKSCIFARDLDVSMLKKRINWIDWAKVIAIVFVVFGHIPQESNSFLMGYICTFHMPLFFLLSGYLASPSVDTKRNIIKHWHTLILPYFLYNLIFYPYWLTRHLLEGGNLSCFEILIKPFFGVLFLQIETPVSCTVNGVTWFLAALLVMRIILNICKKMANMKILLLTALMSVLLNLLVEKYAFFHNLFMNGLIRCYPFFILGYLLKKYHVIEKTNTAINAILFLLLSVLAIYMYITIDVKGLPTFYLLCMLGSLSVVLFCKLLDSYTSMLLVDLSMGTIVIMGLHWIYIGTINYSMEKILSTHNIIYNWYIAVSLSVIIVFAIYPFILLFRRYGKPLLGK